MSNFLKELEALNAPVAEIPDLEDYHFDTKVKSKSRPADYSDAEIDQDEVVLQKRRIFGAVELHDARYKGEKVSRSDMFGDSSEMNGLRAKGKKRGVATESDDEDDEDGSEVDEEEEEDEEEESDDDDIQLDELNGEDDEDDDGSEEDEEEEEGDDDEDEEEEGKITMKELIKPIAEDEEKKKGESVRKQVDMCEQILLLNIKSHGAMRAFNQLPRGEMAKGLTGAADEKTRANLREAHSNALRLVSVLLEAERVLLGGSSQTKDLMKEGKEGAEKKAAADSDDEEIESSEDEEEEKGGKKKGKGKGEKADDEEMEDEEDFEDGDDDGSIPDYNVSGTDDSEEDEGIVKGGQQKGKKVESLRALRKQCIASEMRFEQFRSTTLQKWDGRTRLAAVGGAAAAAAAKQKKGDFSAFEGDVLAQIDKILSDKRRLIARTQSKRSDHERIGGTAESTHDVEIFDDDDFYQVLLRDLIECKQAVDTNDPIAMSRQWLEIEKLRQKRKKKNIDTRASKGRKLRYTVIPKLVNFFAAVPERVDWSHETRNELFKSLFK
ncbi:hypothetical protein PMAYCL1PPCAC_26109 [Pristionchus mayeri]|uniref:Protein AATF n=1 Tax=Pristionchus mayeri TaxID=1317129 RepID=A0AAN5D5B5_9BILA|nr:hypothetical protein PMAYCL1PPCAC_26109 [Pristionchus mayeri]